MWFSYLGPGWRKTTLAVAFRFVAVGVMASAAFALFVDRLLPHVQTHIQPFWLPFISLLLLLVCVEWIVVLLAPLGVIWALIYIATAIDICYVIPDIFQGSLKLPPGTGSIIDVALRTAAAVVLAILAAKLLMLHRYAAIYRQRLRSYKNLTRLDPLPSQENDLNQLERLIEAESSDLPGHVVQLRGRWGDGKSLIIHLWKFQNYMSARRRAPRRNIIHVDVWKRESESDLHLAIIEELLSCPHILLRFGWARFPVTLTIGRSVKDFRLQVGVSASAVKGSADVPVVLPRLRWQGFFERTISRQVSMGRRTVIVLDEIDRATPEVAQTALTLTRRSLDLPGVTIILVYVPSTVTYKVFNPLLDGVLPDLQSTMEAVIEERVGLFESATGPPTAATDNGASFEPGDLRRSIRRRFSAADSDERAFMQHIFSEKYLGTGVREVSKLTAADVAKMAVIVPAISRSINSLLIPIPDDMTVQIERAVIRLHTSYNYTPGAVRSVMASIDQSLATLEQAGRDRKIDVTLTMVVATISAAYDYASLGGSPGRSS